MNKLEEKKDLYVVVASGNAIALTPIVHGDVPSVQEAREREEGKREGEPVYFRKQPFVIEDGGEEKRYMVPVCSGNMFRGISRRLLFDYTLGVLGKERSLADMFDNNYEQARRVAYFLRVGGLTPDGTKAGNVEAGTYEDLRKNIPMLAVAGGVYMAHHFSGEMICGDAVPLAKELVPLLKKVIPPFALPVPEDDLPALGDLIVYTARYSRRAEEERSGIDEKESMPYGVEALPAGTRLYQEMRLVTRRETSVLAFKAMLYLLERYAHLKGIGGMTGKGHGKLLIKYKIKEGYLNKELKDAGEPGPKHLEEYRKWLEENKNAVIDAIKNIPNKLPSTRNQNNQNNQGNSENEEQEGQGENADNSSRSRNNRREGRSGRNA